MDIKKNDELMGKLHEDLILDILKEDYKIIASKTDDYHFFDLYDGKCYYEVKSRNCNVNKYDTTIVGYNKIKFARTCGKDCIFIFSFTDGIYYYKYNDKDNFDVKVCGRSDRGTNEYNMYMYIPISVLKRFD